MRFLYKIGAVFRNQKLLTKNQQTTHPMASRIEALWIQALKTFTGRSNVKFEMCQKNFNKLKCLMNEITADDVHVDKKVLDYVRINPAPMYVIEVFENQDITIAVFLLKTGASLPMHDHPEMHGLLKVINGVIKVDTYTIESGNSKTHARIPAIKHPSTIVRPDDPACMVTPTLKNLHEITCLEGPCAFLDVLSPPYETGKYGEGKRPCTFYKVVANTSDEDKVQLTVTDVPDEFYSETLPYKGQPLQ